MPAADRPVVQTRRPAAAAMFLLSASVIALELTLMRCLAVARWHHFAYLVISTALLGFGASGTLLGFVGERLRSRFSAWATGLALAYALSVTGALRVAESLPLDVRYVLYSGRHAALMLLHDLLLFVPFFLAAAAIGLALMHAGRRVHGVYAANLCGSGAGAAAAIGLMFAMRPERMVYPVAGLGVLSAMLWTLSSPGRRGPLLGAGVLVAGVLAAEGLLAPVELRIDEHKDLAALQRWEAQGGARRVLGRHGPRARLDVYDSPLLHHVMFAGLTATEPPPAQLALLADGHYLSTVLKIDSPADAGTLDHTPMSVPYRLTPGARVLLLGEAGGTNVWLARRFGASHVTVVQPNPQVVDVMLGPLRDAGGGVLAGPDVTVVCAGLRAFLEGTDERYDLIQIVSAEGPAVGATALRSLNEDFLLTVEGMAACLAQLTERGVLAVTRGVQAPPRDNVKLFATLRDALEQQGCVDPGRQLVQVRNLLAATTMAFARPVTACASLAAVARDLALDVEWTPCPGADYSRQVSEAEGPEGEPYSYFHHAAAEIVSPRREGFLRTWAYNVRPATDDSPYFYNFFRWRSLPEFRRAYGGHWVARTELGYVVLVFALAQAVVAGGVLLLLPLVWLGRRGGPGGGRAVTAGYFGLLGAAFMLLEMVCLLKLGRFLDEPIYAASVVLGSFLLFSGLGSATASRLVPDRRRAIGLAGFGIAALAVGYAVGLDELFRLGAGLPLAARLAAAVAAVAPAAFLMGWPFPGGLAELQDARPGLVPWAWGANGFASVAGAPLAVLLAVHLGFRAVFAAAALLYVVAAGVSRRLPAAEPSGGRSAAAAREL
jgi:hypothetical protein